MKNLYETILSSKTKYTGIIINVRQDTVQADGKVCLREVVEHPGGVVVIAMTDDNKIILIKQWRHPIGQELIELPAGKIEKGERGEDPFESAKRELREETGYSALHWEDMGYIFTTPGFCDEKLYFYRATGLILGQTDFDEGEVIHTFMVDFDEAVEMVKTGKIQDAKTIAGIFFALKVSNEQL